MFNLWALSGVLKYPAILSPINAQIENANRLLKVNMVVISITSGSLPESDLSRNCVKISAIMT